MPRKHCDRHGLEHPCTCAMGNIYRFVEPVVLHLLKTKRQSYGYELSQALQDHALTDAEVERAALYRTLRQLEANGNVVSEWETDGGGRHAGSIASRPKVSNIWTSGQWSSIISRDPWPPSSEQSGHLQPLTDRRARRVVLPSADLPRTLQPGNDARRNDGWGARRGAPKPRR